MAHKRIKSSRFPGVYWRETTDSTRRYNGRPDKCYDYCIRVNGKLKWVNVGWLSEGFSEQKAANLRREALEKLAKGDMYIQGQWDKYTLNMAADTYFIWVRNEGKYLEDDRYNTHVIRFAG